jgi:hypothetical protein
VRPHMRVRSLSAWKSAMHCLLCGFDTLYATEDPMLWVATKGSKNPLLLLGFEPKTWDTPSNNETTIPLLCFCQTWNLFLYIIIFNMQKTPKSYVLTAYIAPHRNPHMRPHVAYAICNASPHAYSNPHFKTLNQTYTL